MLHIPLVVVVLFKVAVCKAEDGGEERGLCLETVVKRSTAMSWVFGQLGDISASGPLVFTLTQWVTGGNKAYPYSPEQFKDSPACRSFLSLIQLFSNLRVNQNHLEAC